MGTNQKQSEKSGVAKERAEKKRKDAIKKRAEYLLFVEWCAMPLLTKKKLGIETQGDFAKEHSLNKDTLTNWKKREGFDAKVDRAKRSMGRDHWSVVVQGWLTACAKGNPLAIELWLAYFEGWDKKQVLEHKGDVSFGENDVRALIAFLPEKEQKEFYDNIIGLLAKARSARSRGEYPGADGK